ncbi:g853 [Coccomyxa viridis]|uniref:G853 protein n=1 Tax=Coccomyxa viridis TaxID=1274662 RepID=A0ABP1FNH9_9CHLO
MTGIGVGEQATTPLAAVFQFFVRDLAGMLGGVVFAFVQGSDLDIYAKQWRLFADCVNNVGYIADLLSPVFPDAFLLLACIGSLSRAITGVAGGATRAALTQHFALTGNAADIAAKEGSQETATTLIGMVVGMLVLRVAAGHDLLIWSIFLLLSFMHIYANIKAARSLQLTSLNPARLDILLAHYLAMHEMSVLRPKHVAALEPLLPPRVTRLWQRLLSGAPGMEVRMGARMSDQENVQEELAAMGGDKKHLIALEQGGSCASVVLRVDCTADDVLDAYVHAFMLLHAKLPLDHSFEAATRRMEKAWPKLRGELRQAGWSLKGASLCPSPWRAAWGSQLPSNLHVD